MCRAPRSIRECARPGWSSNRGRNSIMDERYGAASCQHATVPDGRRNREQQHWRTKSRTRCPKPCPGNRGSTMKVANQQDRPGKRFALHANESPGQTAPHLTKIEGFCLFSRLEQSRTTAHDKNMRSRYHRRPFYRYDHREYRRAPVKRVPRSRNPIKFGCCILVAPRRKNCPSPLTGDRPSRVRPERTAMTPNLHIISARRRIG